MLPICFLKQKALLVKGAGDTSELGYAEPRSLACEQRFNWERLCHVSVFCLAWATACPEWVYSAGLELGNQSCTTAAFWRWIWDVCVWVSPLAGTHRSSYCFVCCSECSFSFLTTTSLVAGLMLTLIQDSSRRKWFLRALLDLSLNHRHIELLGLGETPRII